MTLLLIGHVLGQHCTQWADGTCSAWLTEGLYCHWWIYCHASVELWRILIYCIVIGRHSRQDRGRQSGRELECVWTKSCGSSAWEQVHLHQWWVTVYVHHPPKMYVVQYYITALKCRT